MSICRLCNGPTKPLFEKLQLQKYEVKYFECLHCQSAQTERPYWIEEAYKDLSFALDTGMVARTLACASLTLALALEINLSQKEFVADFGGGTGLCTRILRDHGLQGLWMDKYATNIFAKGFEAGNEKIKILTAFEVLEHLTEPSLELKALFDLSCDYLLVTTKLYQGQDSSWWYFLEDGQHVQFYSEKALGKIAQEAGYYYYTAGSTYHLFSKIPHPKKIVKSLLKKSPKAFARAVKKWPSFTEQDHHYVKRLTKP